jgi:hypothetical protein
MIRGMLIDLDNEPGVERGSFIRSLSLQSNAPWLRWRLSSIQLY